MDGGFSAINTLHPADRRATMGFFASGGSGRTEATPHIRPRSSVSLSRDTSRTAAGRLPARCPGTSHVERKGPITHMDTPVLPHLPGFTDATTKIWASIR
jgi:hypothetical protein